MNTKNRQTFEKIITDYRQKLLKIAVTFEADPKLQQDLHQEILLAIWQALVNFKGESSVTTYIYRVAYNQALNHVANYSRLPLQEELDDTHHCQEHNPEDKTASSQDLDGLMNAIRRLPVTQRQLITLALNGVSYADIANITGFTVSNVGVQLNRAKKELANILGDNS